MASITRHRAVLGLAVALIALPAGCGTTSSATSPNATRNAGRHSRALPVPFQVVARWSARSLGLAGPAAVAIGPDGNLYVIDSAQHVTVISPSGKVLRRWGKPGSGPGEFELTPEDPTDPMYVNGKIAVSRSGLVYVSDNGNARVQVFTGTGRFIRQFGGRGTGPGQFLYPFDIAVDPAGGVYVADDQNVGVIQKFSPTGRFIWRIGGSSSSNQDLAGHHHFFEVDGHGRLVAISDNTGDVMYIDSNGRIVDSFNTTNRVFQNDYAAGSACEVSTDAVGNTYVTACGAGPTLVYNAAHQLVGEYNGPHDHLLRSPVFGPRREVFAIGYDPTGQFGGELLKLRMALPGA